jgi:Uma2 family endonuclease
MPVVPERRLTAEEYLQIERAAEFKSEFYRGQMAAMSGASREHNLIAGNIARKLGNQLERGPCEVYQSDMRVKVSRTGLYTYPDVAVVCSEPRFEDKEVDTLLNPTLLVEVLSKSTANRDNYYKLNHYRRIPALREVVIVDQFSMLVVLYSRQGDGSWAITDYAAPDERVPLESIGCSLPLTEIYAKVKLPEADEGQADGIAESSGG